MRTEHDLKLMQYAQGALLGEVAPSFRAVSFQLSPDGEDFIARFIFDGEPLAFHHRISEPLAPEQVANVVHVGKSVDMGTAGNRRKRRSEFRQGIRAREGQEQQSARFEDPTKLYERLF